MESLPDDIWLKIFEAGINNSTLHYDDLRNISMSCKAFYQLSNDNTLWSILLTLNNPDYAAKYSSSFSSCPSVKSLYQYTKAQRTHEVFGDFSKLLIDIMDRDPVRYYQNMVKYSDSRICGPGESAPAPRDIMVYMRKKREQLLCSQQGYLAAQQKTQRKIDILLGRQIEHNDNGDHDEEENHAADDDNSDHDEVDATD